MKEKALELFEAGYNCAQAVVCAYCDKYGLSSEFARQIAFAFGGGIGGSAKHLCGAVNGALMVIGLHCAGDVGDKPAKDKMKQKTKQFFDELEKQHQSLICIDLLKEKDKADSMHADKCNGFVAEVCDVLEKVLAD